MKIDCHVHVQHFLKNGEEKAYKLIHKMKACGINGFVCTDHVKFEELRSGTQQMNRCVENYRMMTEIGLRCIYPHIWFGMEVSDRGNHYLLYGYEPGNENFKDLLFSAEENLFDRVKKTNGIMIQAHPLRMKNGKWRATFVDHRVHGYEINARFCEAGNQMFGALRFNARKMCAISCGSDAHLLSHVGKAAVIVDDDFMSRFEETDDLYYWRIFNSMFSLHCSYYEVNGAIL